jgi:hypothetical protein
MRTQIIQVPYDSGYKNYRMGRGPGQIVRHLKAEMTIPIDAPGTNGVEVRTASRLRSALPFWSRVNSRRRFVMQPVAGISPWC